MTNISFPRDNNRIAVIGGTSSTDGITPTTIYVDPTTHRMLVNSTGSSSIVLGTTTITGGTTGQLLYDNGGVVGELAVATYPSLTELSYVKGVTSAIQTQLNNKQASGTYVTAIGVTTANGVSGSSSGGTTPNLTMTLGAITPTSVTIGTLGYSDTNILISGQANVNTYDQFIIQNTNSGAAASADFVVSNNNSTSTTYYGNFGMNSSGFSGSGALNGVNNVYLTATTGDLVVGTTTSNAIHFVINGGTTDAMTINTANIVSIPNLAVGWTSTATVAGTTTLTVASNYQQYFTGTSTQTVLLPTTSIVAGQQYSITNQSTGSVTVQSSGANTIIVLGAGQSAVFTALTATPTTAANWAFSLIDYFGITNAITASGNAATINLAYKTNVVTNNSAATLTVTIPTAGAVDKEMRVVSIVDFSAVAQTLAWVNTENSTVTAPVLTNGSTTLPLTVGFQYNAATSKWRCIASA